MATVAEMAVTAASEGVQAVSERWQLLWWQQGDCRNGDTKRWQQWRQKMVAAMEAATGSADGNNGGSKEKRGAAMCSDGGREGQRQQQ